MKVLCDRHHADLLYSLQKLFEDRLGFELYITIGHKWWDAEIWRFGQAWGDDRLAQQFLNTAPFQEVEPGLFLTFDEHHPERPIYGVTLERARYMKWDFILATVQDNQQGFQRFAREMSARYLYQVGNARQWIDQSLEPIIIDASQEFDHLTTFRYRVPTRMTRVVSFVNLLPLIPESWRPFDELSRLCPEFEFKSFGHNCPDGFLKPVAAVAEEMSRASWAYHDKPTGDGFGHIIHNWAAVGRPLIGHSSFYTNQRAEIFWQDGKTCIDLDKHSIEETAALIRGISKDQHETMCRTIRDVFQETYNPAMDADRISLLLKAE